jgi:ubiquinone/menaquinone biosynthesis C-methylase UbiE
MLDVDYNDKNYDYTKYWNGRDYENTAEFLALKKLLPKGKDESKSIIDIGGGFGRLIPIFRDHFGSITVFDYSQKLLDLAKETGNQAGVPVKTIQCDIYEISTCSQDRYDYAAMVRVSHHLKDLQAVFEQIRGVLNDRGIFILEIANKMHFKSIMKNLVRCNFKYFTQDSVSIATREVTFMNHHPKKIEKMLKNAGFRIDRVLSVSNFRSSFIKKLFPIKLLLKFEDFGQGLLSSFYFGPSIFYKLVKE